MNRREKGLISLLLIFVLLSAYGFAEAGRPPQPVTVLTQAQVQAMIDASVGQSQTAMEGRMEEVSKMSVYRWAPEIVREYLDNTGVTTNGVYTPSTVVVQELDNLAVTKDGVYTIVNTEIASYLSNHMDAIISAYLDAHLEERLAPYLDAITPVEVTYDADVTDFGAVGNGSTDDTEAIQDAIDSLSSGGTVYVPTGTYMVDALTSIKMKSNVNMILADDAVIKAIPNSSDSYIIIDFSGCSNAGISGGTIQGDRDDHDGDGYGAYYQCWGMGILVGPNANGITISDITVKDVFGDGVDIDDGNVSANTPQNINMTRVVVDNNRRTGYVIYSVKGLNMIDCTAQNTGGCSTEDGFNIEPNYADQYVKNVYIKNFKAYNNGNKLDPVVSVDFGQWGMDMWLGANDSGLNDPMSVPKANVSITIDGYTGSGNYRGDISNNFAEYQANGYDITLLV